MDPILQYSVNIAMEATMIPIMLFLLVTCFIQKKRFSTTKPLIAMISCTLLLLCMQILTWVFFIRGTAATGSPLPRVVYALDFLLYTLVGAAFYFYLEALIRDKQGDYPNRPWVGRAVLLWGLADSLAYAAFLFCPWFYRVEDGAQIFNAPAYAALIAVGFLTTVVSAVTIFHHRKALALREQILLCTYLLIPNVLLCFDILYSLSFSYVALSILIFFLYIHIDLHRDSVLVEQEKDLIAKEMEVSELQTEILLSQMQPHFLYNVLTTISGMCEMQGAQDARDVVNRFADYVRVNLDAMGKERSILFEKELEHIKTYLWLEKVRFEDAINVRYEIGTTDFTVPSLIVQPIVENAVKHGILPKEGGGTVTVKTEEAPDAYVITVADDGVGFDADAIPNDNRGHVGIPNVTKRLKTLCGGTCEIRSEIGAGTTVTIRIPKKEA